MEWVLAMCSAALVGGCQTPIDDLCVEGCERSLREGCGGFSGVRCQELCEAARDIAAGSGCVREHQAIWECFATGPGCGSATCTDVSQELYACVEENPPDACTRYCYGCGSLLNCPYSCALQAHHAAETGCAAEQDRYQSCLADTCDLGSCGEEHRALEDCQTGP